MPIAAKKVSAFALLVLFAKLAFAAEVPTVSPIFGDWVPVAALAVLVAYLISALAFMIGIGFKYDIVTEWAKTEFWEATLSAFMVAIIFFIVVFVSGIATTLTGMDHIQAANNYVDEALGKLWNVLGGALGVIQAYAYLSSFWFRFPIPIPILPYPICVICIRNGTLLALWAGYGQVLSGFAPLFYMLWIALLSLYAVKAFLIFSSNNMLSVFLPLGLMCRAFHLTRKIGGTLIAMALTLYFVYPLSLALCKSIFDIYASSMLVGTENIAGAPSAFGLELVGMISGQNVHFLFDLMTPGLQIFTAVMVLNVLILIITITAFRALAVTVGGDPQIFGLSKLGA
jgi:hypothetical protein